MHYAVRPILRTALNRSCAVHKCDGFEFAIHNEGELEYGGIRLSMELECAYCLRFSVYMHHKSSLVSNRHELSGH